MRVQLRAHYHEAKTTKHLSHPFIHLSYAWPGTCLSVLSTMAKIYLFPPSCGALLSCLTVMLWALPDCHWCHVLVLRVNLMTSHLSPTFKTHLPLPLNP